MNPDLWMTAAVVLGALALLLCTRIAVDAVMMAALTVLLLAGTVTSAQALSGFANEGMATVGVLYVVAAGLRRTGVMGGFARVLFGRPRGVRAAQLRLMLPVASLSAFMNNTPLVAALLPAVSEWGRNLGIPLSRLMMPLSFATILGGLCTLIGTSTNVIIAGLTRDAVEAGRLEHGLGFFTLGAVGLPCAVAGIAFMVLAGRWLLPRRDGATRDPARERSYWVEMQVDVGGPVAGRTIEQAGLRHLRGAYLAEVERDGELLPAVGPAFRLQGGDRVMFVGVVDAVVELQKIRGLSAAPHAGTTHGDRYNRTLVEAVVSDRCPLLGKSIREGRFRTQYNAVVIAVARSGEELRQKIGDIVLRAGDTLLLEARPAFVQQQRDARDFYLVSGVPDTLPPRHDKALIALVILAGMIVMATLFEQLPWFQARGFGVLHAALIAAGLTLATRCCSVSEARQAVDWQVLVVIGATIGIGKAVESSGLSTALAAKLATFGADTPLAQLAVLYFATMLMTELLSNNTAAVLMFPLALATAGQLGLDALPFIVAVTIAASCGFATPLGYQTNLMVYGPGGYRFADFVRFGAPLNLVVAAVTLGITPLVFPFQPA